MQVPISDIIVKKRLRRDMGDIEALALSMKRYGQISPIVISRNNVLIAGGRRLEAAKTLGWRTINVVVSEASGKLSLLELEAEENIQRRAFNREEEAAAVKKINRLRNPSLLRKILNAIRGFFQSIIGLFKR